MLLKFIKFGLVGFSGLIIDFSVTYLLKEKFGIHRFIANSFGFAIAATSNYYLNRLWTFHSSNPHLLAEYRDFLIVSIVGLAINNFFLFTFEKRFKFYFSKLLAIGITIIWNFFANYLITFNT